MSQQELLQFVTGLLPTWRKTRLRVLVLGSLALAGDLAAVQERGVHGEAAVARDDAGALPHPAGLPVGGEAGTHQG